MKVGQADLVLITSYLINSSERENYLDDFAENRAKQNKANKETKPNQKKEKKTKQ